MSRPVAVLIPVYRETLTPDEEISLQRLQRFLPHCEKFLILPKGIQVDLPGFEKREFAWDSTAGTNAYSKLLLSRQFYEAFTDFEYVLIYQLDCLLFSGNLAAWCQTGYDYIGAPFFRSTADPRRGFSRAGNGGLSLRKVASFLRVLNSQRYIQESVAFWHQVFAVRLEDLTDRPPLQRFVKKLRVLRDVRKGVEWYTANYSLNEDRFWSDRAALFDPEFRIAPVETSLGFSFERFPQYCFDRNNRQLPFGCHAWAKWDRAFWEPHIGIQAQ